MDCRKTPFWVRPIGAFCFGLALLQFGTPSTQAGNRDDYLSDDPAASVLVGDNRGHEDAENYPDLSIESVCDDCCGCCCTPCCCPVWNVRAGTILLGRAGNSRQSFIFNENELGKPGSEIVNSGDFGSAWAGGPDLSITRCLDRCRSLEVRYFGIDGWTNQTSRSGDLFVVLPVATVPGTGTATVSTGSDLYSVEVNIRRWTTDWFAWLVGLRFVEFNDGTLMQFAAPEDSPRNLYAIDTNNHLYGGQIGAEVVFGSVGYWRLDGWLKAGVFANSADQSTNLLLPFRGSVSASGDRTALLGSVGLSAIRPVTNWLAFRTGYQAMWLDGVALASTQLGHSNVSNNFARLDKNDGVFFHGVTIGLEAWW